MIPLHQLQKRFVASLIMGIIDPVLFSLFTSNDPASADKSTIHERFEMYRNNWRENLFKTLKNIYPVCCCLVGEACFRALSQLFIQHSISQHFSLNAFGRDFAFFLEKYAEKWSLPYLPDVAKLEWMIHITLLGPANNHFSFENLLTIPEQKQSEVIFKLAENGSLFFSPYPIEKIWAAHQEAWQTWQQDTEQQDTEQEDRGQHDTWQTTKEKLNVSDITIPNIINLSEGKTYLFIYREDSLDYAIRLATLTSLEWQLLTEIAAGKTLGELYKKFIDIKEQEIILALTACLQKGYITGMQHL